jgi:hypothetical protein
MREQARGRIASLPESDRSAAIKVLKARDRPYWFGDEFASPSVLLEKLADQEFANIYRTFSAAAHGGFLGMRLLRDDPDLWSINPQRPVQSKSLSVLVTSGRLLVEVISLRSRHESLDLESVVQHYRFETHQLAAGGTV